MTLYLSSSGTLKVDSNYRLATGTCACECVGTNPCGCPSWVGGHPRIYFRDVSFADDVLYVNNLAAGSNELSYETTVSNSHLPDILDLVNTADFTENYVALDTATACEPLRFPLGCDGMGSRDYIQALRVYDTGVMELYRYGSGDGTYMRWAGNWSNVPCDGTYVLDFDDGYAPTGYTAINKLRQTFGYYFSADISFVGSKATVKMFAGSKSPINLNIPAIDWYSPGFNYGVAPPSELTVTTTATGHTGPYVVPLLDATDYPICSGTGLGGTYEDYNFILPEWYEDPGLYRLVAYLSNTTVRIEFLHWYVVTGIPTVFSFTGTRAAPVYPINPSWLQGAWTGTWFVTGGGGGAATLTLTP